MVINLLKDWAKSCWRASRRPSIYLLVILLIFNRFTGWSLTWDSSVPGAWPDLVMLVVGWSAYFGLAIGVDLDLRSRAHARGVDNKQLFDRWYSYSGLISVTLAAVAGLVVWYSQHVSLLDFSLYFKTIPYPNERETVLHGQLAVPTVLLAMLFQLGLWSIRRRAQDRRDPPNSNE